MDGVLHRFVVNGCRGVAGAALGYDIACAAFAAPALGGDTQLKLDFVEAHACVCMACDFAIRDSAAYTDDHGNRHSGY